MGQKVNPHGLRVGVIKDWDSRWYAEDKFADYLVEDYNIRTFLKKKLYSAGVSKIEIEMCIRDRYNIEGTRSFYCRQSDLHHIVKSCVSRPADIGLAVHYSVMFLYNKATSTAKIKFLLY